MTLSEQKDTFLDEVPHSEYVKWLNIVLCAAYFYLKHIFILKIFYPSSVRNKDIQLLFRYKFPTLKLKLYAKMMNLILGYLTMPHLLQGLLIV